MLRVTHVLAVLLLIFILAKISQVVTALVIAKDESHYRAVEYERARRHYTQIVRHRVINPVTVITGSAHTLKTGTVCGDPEIHGQLCDAIIDKATEVQKFRTSRWRQNAVMRSNTNSMPSLASGMASHRACVGIDVLFGRARTKRCGIRNVSRSELRRRFGCRSAPRSQPTKRCSYFYTSP